MIRKIIILYLVFANLIFCQLAYGAGRNVEEVDLIIKDHKFDPEVLYLPEGKKIRITVHNKDSTIEEFESIDLKREKIVLGNSKTYIILAPLKPGEYKFFGDFHSETANGKIIVKESTEDEIDQDV